MLRNCALIRKAKAILKRSVLSEAELRAVFSDTNGVVVMVPSRNDFFFLFADLFGREWSAYEERRPDISGLCGKHYLPNPFFRWLLSLTGSNCRA